MTVQNVNSVEYGRPLATVFGEPAKRYSLAYDEDDDPVIDHLRILDHRYMRFCFNPLKDKFILCNSWKDPAWTDVRAIRIGIDGDEKDSRELAFGNNVIEIEQKTIPQLLVDEVIPFPSESIAFVYLQTIGISSLLCVPDRKSHTLVFG